MFFKELSIELNGTNTINGADLTNTGNILFLSALSRNVILRTIRVNIEATRFLTEVCINVAKNRISRAKIHNTIPI